jgi:hypothetical protein
MLFLIKGHMHCRDISDKNVSAFNLLLLTVYFCVIKCLNWCQRDYVDLSKDLLWENELNRSFQIAIKYLRKCSASLTIKEMQIKLN